jgi:hypothetical protein
MRSRKSNFECKEKNTHMKKQKEKEKNALEISKLEQLPGIMTRMYNAEALVTPFDARVSVSGISRNGTLKQRPVQLRQVRSGHGGTSTDTTGSRVCCTLDAVHVCPWEAHYAFPIHPDLVKKSWILEIFWTSWICTLLARSEAYA